MRRVLPLVLAALCAAGCLSPLQGGGVQRVCLGLPMALEWRQEGLHEALPEAARRAGVALEERAAAGGVPLGSAGAFPEGARLVTLAYMPNGRGPPPGPTVVLQTEPDGRTRVFVMDVADDAEAVTLLRGFLAGVGLADAPGASSWERAVLAGWHETASPYYEAVLALPLAPDALDEGAFRTVGPRLDLGVGEATLANGQWQAQVRVPTRALALGAGLDRVRVTADAWGAVKAESVFAREDAGNQDLRARIDGAFAALGLPPPTYEDARGADASC